MESEDKNLAATCLSRRGFLLAGGAVILLPDVTGIAHAATTLRKEYPRREIARLTDIVQDTPIAFRYPYKDHILCNSFIVKLGEIAGGGVGADNDIVAFNSFCPHMGGPLMGVYNREYKVAGPCPLHLSTFDLTRHGMLVSGHATEGLPQVVLELEGGVIYAVGMQGLMYGFSNNLETPRR